MKNYIEDVDGKGLFKIKDTTDRNYGIDLISNETHMTLSVENYHSYTHLLETNDEYCLFVRLCLFKLGDEYVRYVYKYKESNFIDEEDCNDLYNSLHIISKDEYELFIDEPDRIKFVYHNIKFTQCEFTSEHTLDKTIVYIRIFPIVDIRRDYTVRSFLDGICELQKIIAYNETCKLLRTYFKCKRMIPLSEIRTDLLSPEEYNYLRNFNLAVWIE